MKIAVLSNPSSGGGTKAAGALAALKDAWSAHSLIGVSGFGGEFFSACLPAPMAEGYTARLEEALGKLLKLNPDFLVTVGGDGTAAYAAEFLLRSRCDLPVFGLGSGTANVGPIVTARAGDDLPDPERLVPFRIGAVEALTAAGEHIAFGFNDLVLGNTFLGTLSGEMATFDAEKLARAGELVPAVPLPAIVSGNASWKLNGEALSLPAFPAAQLIASPVDRENFYGRAVTGVLCCTPGSPYKAAVYVPSVPLISCEPFDDGFTRFLSGAQLLLSPEDRLEINDLDPAVCVIADGNPYLIPAGTVTLRCRPDLITVLQRSL